MGLTNVRLGDWVRELKQTCGIPDLTADQVSGVNRDKEFFEPSRQVGSDTSNYKLVPEGYFACNLMHVGRDALVPIALNHSGSPKVVSPAYTVFEILSGAPLLTEYFFIMLKSSERDRYFWMHTDASIRDGMSWQDFCDVEFLVPSLETQQRYVDVYQSVAKNQAVASRSLADLRLAYELQLEKAKRAAPLERVGSLLRNVDHRNKDLRVQCVKGINIEKRFIDSVAKVSSQQLIKYKLVLDHQFAYSAMQTGRDRCIRIALHTNVEPLIVSPAYSVLEVIDPNRVLPEFIMIWFSRAESDRYGWFASDASIRANLDLERFFEIQIPVPGLAEQRSTVALWKAREERYKSTVRTEALLKDLCPVLIKGSLDEARREEVAA